MEQYVYIFYSHSCSSIYINDITIIFLYNLCFYHILYRKVELVYYT